MYKPFNPNPAGKRVGDCVVRAICRLFDLSWEDAFAQLTLKAYAMHDMPSSNDVWGTYLLEHGFKRFIIPDSCPDCYTVRQFCVDNPNLIGILATGTHVIAISSGDYFDTWDSGDEVPIYYWRKEN